MKKLYLFMLVVLLLTGCVYLSKIGVNKHTGFIELPFPSNIYASGQIVEIYSKPRKVEITYDPSIPWDQARVSDGWNISSSKINDIRLIFSTEISKVLKSKYNYVSKENVKVEFTNTKTRTIEKHIIYTALKNAIKETPSLKEQLVNYMDYGTEFEIITTTLSADISFTLIDTSKNEVVIDPEVIEKLNADFIMNFNKERGSNKIISGSNLIVGIHTDPKMVSMIMKEI